MPSRRPTWIRGRDLDQRTQRPRANDPLHDPSPLAEMLRDLLQRSTLGLRLVAHDPDLRTAVAEALGPAMAARCEPVSLEDGVLELRVLDPSWRFELSFRRTDLLARIQATRLGLRVRSLRIR